MPYGFTLRPVRETDLAPLADLVGNIAGGLTTLPNNPRYLEEKIHASLRAFYPRIEHPGAEHYLFVLEDARSGQLVGTSGIVAQVGGFDPFYTYEIRHEKQCYAPLQINRQMRALHLKRSHKGPSEICSLFLHPDHRRGGLGKLLSLSRFLFMHRFPVRFDTDVIAELRGYLDPSGQSPFWEAVGKVFFRRDYYTADILSGLGEKGFIEALMPRYPIYTALLPKAAREVIGVVHRDTEAALHVLCQEGFTVTNEVDIFDAGPLVRAPIATLKTVRSIRSGPVCGDLPVDHQRRFNALVTNRALAFRARLATLEETAEGTLRLDPDTLAQLELENGGMIDYVLLDA